MTSTQLADLAQIGQPLVHTLGVDVQTVRILDGLRRQRSGSNHEVDTVTDAALAECLRQSRIAGKT